MKILVNDEEVEVDGETTVAGLLDRLGYPQKGIAVAVDWTVIPRSRLGHNPFRRRAHRGRDGGAGWLTRC